MLITETSHNTVVSGLNEMASIAILKRREIEQDLHLQRQITEGQQTEILNLRHQNQTLHGLCESRQGEVERLFKKCDEQEGSLRLLHALVENGAKAAQLSAKKKGKK